MRVDEVMTKDVVTVAPDTPLRTAALKLAGSRISGLPVVDAAGELVGVISEADLLVKEQGAAHRQTRGRRPFDRRAAESERRGRGRVVADLMTSPARTIAPYRSVAVAAAEMLEHGINRLPVVDAAGELVGIVTRADLVRAFARTDAQIASEASDQIAHYLALDGELSQVRVTVADGEAKMDGTVRRQSAATALPELVASVPGVVGVRSTLTWLEDEVEPARERAQLGVVPIWTYTVPYRHS